MTDSPSSRVLVSIRATVDSPDRTRVFARSHGVVLGKGWSFDRLEPAATGAETLLGLLTADVLGLFLDVCKRQRLVIDAAEATAQAELVEPLAHLGVIGAEGCPHYDHFVLKAFVSSPEPETALQAAWEQAGRRAPLLQTLCRGAAVHLSLSFI